MLNQPSISKIILLSIVSFGLYLFYWCAKSAQAVNQSAKQKLVPTAWMLVLPGLNYYWVWQYANALQATTFGRIKQSDVFLLFVIPTFLFSPFSVFNFLPNNASGQTGFVFIIIVAVLCVAYGMFISAFFCSVIQQKINSSININSQK